MTNIATLLQSRFAADSEDLLKLLVPLETLASPTADLGAFHGSEEATARWFDSHLRELAACIDRALDCTRERRDLAAREIAFRISYDQAHGLYAIFLGDIANGRFSTGVKVAEATISSLEHRVQMLCQSIASFEELIRMRRPTAPLLAAHRQLVVHQHQGNQSDKDNVASATKAIQEHAIHSEIIDLERRKNELATELQSVTRELEVANCKLALAEKEEARERRRWEIELGLLEQRLALSNEPGGDLNFREAHSFLINIMSLELSAARTYFRAVRLGLASVYGSCEQLDRISGESEVLQTRKLAVWCRRASELLRTRSDASSNATILISLRRHLGQDSWARAIRGEEFVLEITEQSIGRLVSARIVRTDLFVRHFEKDDGTERWTAQLRAPSVGVYYHGLSDGSTHGELEQRDVPVMTTSCLATRAADPSPVSWTSASRGLSPYGEWRIQVSAESLAGTALTADDDIEFELWVSVHRV